MSIPGIGPGKKGRDTTMFFFRFLAILTTPVSFAHRLDYRSSPINQVRASEYEMDIGCSVSTSMFSTRKRARPYLSPVLKEPMYEQSELNKFSNPILNIL